MADFSDRELLAIVADNAVHDGDWALAIDITAQVFPRSSQDDRADSARRCISIRLAWMRRYGVVDKGQLVVDNQRETAWRLTDAGLLFLRAQLPKAMETRLEKMGEGDYLPMVSWLADRYRRVGVTSATMMRREWQRGMLPR